MKRQRGSFKSHITKSLVKAQERRCAIALQPEARLQSRPGQEAVIPISCLRHTAMTAHLKCEGKALYYSFLCVDMFFLPRTRRIHCDSAHECFCGLMKRDGGATGITFV